MIQKDRVINMPHRHAVMVDNNHAAAFFVEFLAFQQALLVGIGYDQQGVGVMSIGLFRGNKVVVLTCLVTRFSAAARQRCLAAARQ